MIESMEFKAGAALIPGYKDDADLSRCHPAALNQAFRAALMITGRAGLAENSVLDGIASLEAGEDFAKALVAKTVHSAIRQRAMFPNQLEQALALLPQELRWLTLLTPVSRDCYLLRILFAIPAASCAAILNLTMEEFEESLCVAFRQLSVPEAV